MMRKALARALVLSGTLGLSATVTADDTDLFLVEGALNTTSPNVLFVIDNSANWNATLYTGVDGTKYTKKIVEHAALKAALVTSDEFEGRLNVGFMTFSNGNSPEGGKVIKAVQPLTYEFQTKIDEMLYDVDNHELLPGTNNAPYASMLNEAYRYFRGLAPMSGLQDGNYDPAAVAEGVYASPLQTNNIDVDGTNLNACAKQIIVFIGNGGPDNGENTYAERLLTSLGGKLANDPLRLDPNNYAANWGDEYARFMNGIDIASNLAGTQNITTYVIDVVNPDKADLKTEKAARAYLNSIAERGGGTYFKATNADEIIAAINSIFDELQAVNNVYAATTLPVSVNVRGTNLNQVYIGVFRPDADRRPRWFGNLKLYQLGYNTGTQMLYLADKNNLAAESASGFIVNNAVSFWTTPSEYWYFSPRGTPPSSSDSPDGEVVEKGGAAQKLRDNHPNRNLYTCTGNCASNSLLSGTTFATTNTAVTQAALGTADAAATTALVDWVKGYDNLNADGDLDATNVRPCIHGDVLHSRPAVINYNRNGDDNDVVAFYGANDGVFHAVKGGKNTSDGYELWGFIPEEFFGKLKQLRDNAVMDDANPKPYFVDGSIGVYQYDSNSDGRLVSADGDKLYLYLSMRRGGRLIYALDASDPNNPRFLWKRDNTSTGYSELGQTWSEPKVAKINYNGTAKTVLIFGGGYDPGANDTQPAGTATMGRGIFIVDALTGNVLWQAGPNPTGAAHNVQVTDMIYSIPSDVTVLDRDRDNNKYVDRVYVGDTGGNVWRVDIGDVNGDGTSDPAEWAIHKLAAVGGADANARKFLYPPDVVYDREDDGTPYDAVLIGSGDREHPFDETITNRFYMFKDRMTGLSGAGQDTITEANLYDATANLIQVGTDAQKTEAKTALAGGKGWYITLGTGEKVVTSAVTMAGSTFFSTNQPSAVEPGTCANLGIARTYTVGYKDATATMNYDTLEGLTTADRSTRLPGGGYPPSPVPVIVELDGKKYEAVVSGTSVLTPPGTKLDARRRVFWYKEKID